MDASAALAIEGVAGYYGASDVPGSNIIGPTKYDEEVFAKDIVTCVGQVRYLWIRLGRHIGVTLLIL